MCGQSEYQASSGSSPLIPKDLTTGESRNEGEAVVASLLRRHKLSYLRVKAYVAPSKRAGRPQRGSVSAATGKQIRLFIDGPRYDWTVKADDKCDP